MGRRRLDLFVLVGVVAALAALMRVPPQSPVPAAADPVCSGPSASGLRIVVDNGIDDEGSFVFQLGKEGVYETRMHVDDRDYTLHGSMSPAELERFSRELEPHTRASALCPPLVLHSLSIKPRRYRIDVWDGDGKRRDICIDDPWSPRYQSLQRFLNRTIVGRTHEALKKAAGL